MINYLQVSLYGRRFRGSLGVGVQEGLVEGDGGHVQLVGLGPQLVEGPLLRQNHSVHGENLTDVTAGTKSAPFLIEVIEQIRILKKFL